MTIDTGLRIAAIGLPFAGALVIWRMRARFPRAQRVMAALILATTALIALALFLLNRYYACVLAFREESCLFDGLGTLSLLVWSALFARSSLVMQGQTLGARYIPMLLFAAGWAGACVGQNLFLLVVSMNLLLFAIDRWLKTRGTSWQFLVLRDGYSEDEGSGRSRRGE